MEELKRLPTQEKVNLIAQLLHSIHDNDENEQEADESDTDPEIVKEMERRLDDMKSGKDPGYTWEEAKAIWLQNIKKRKIARAQV